MSKYLDTINHVNFQKKLSLNLKNNPLFRLEARRALNVELEYSSFVQKCQAFKLEPSSSRNSTLGVLLRDSKIPHNKF
jgi:hypothetical protein